MNWGKRIIVGMALFIGFILTMVVIMMRQKIDLVEEDYYKRELNYESQMDAQKNYASALEKIQLQAKNDSLLVYFPAAFREKEVTIALQRPNDKNHDLVLNAKPLEKVVIKTTEFPKGIFTCTINGQIEGLPYEMSQQVTIH
ncbi:hypothetical protein D3C87_83900 [compost metagenome]